MSFWPDGVNVCCVKDCFDKASKELPVGDKFIYMCAVHFKQWRRCCQAILKQEYLYE